MTHWGWMDPGAMADLEQGLLWPFTSLYKQAPFPNANNELVQRDASEPAAPPFYQAYLGGDLQAPPESALPGAPWGSCLSSLRCISPSLMSPPRSPEYLNVGNSPTPQGLYVQKGSYSVTTYTKKTVYILTSNFQWHFHLPSHLELRTLAVLWLHPPSHCIQSVSIVSTSPVSFIH